MKNCLWVSTLLLASCLSQSWEDRFSREYDWDKPSDTTTIHKIKVAFPCWLAKEDRILVLNAIDTYATEFLNAYPWAKENFPIARYTVWIHDAVGGFVAGSRDWSAWARGWALGKYVIVAWGYDTDALCRPCGISTKDILPALTHEWVHMLLNIQYGNADPGHFLYFPTPEIQAAIIQPRLKMLSLPALGLSEKTKKAAHSYRYFPWIIPGESE